MHSRIPLAAALVPVFLACGCAAGIDGQAHAGPHAPPGLERFYEQRPAWGPCTGTEVDPADAEAFGNPELECATVQVPLDYAAPTGRIAQIAVLRQSAGDGSARIGSLLINPGGPGESGRSTVAALSGGDDPLSARLDLVGFDPRGVGASTPSLRCFTDAEVTDSDLPDVDLSEADVEAAEARLAQMAERCAERVGRDVLAHAGTVNGARDLDVLRAVLGDPRLTYLGFSYGTFLGTKYAEQFPDRVRALVLDGAVDPAKTEADEAVSDAQGLQRAFQAFVALCLQQDVCWTSGADTADADYQALVRPLLTEPRPVGGRVLTADAAITATIAMLYDDDTWPDLDAALVDLAAGGGGLLLEAADGYEHRDAGGYVEDPFVKKAIECVDDDPIRDPEQERAVAARVRAAVPFLDFGTPPGNDRDLCAFWPVPPTSHAGPAQVPGLGPALVISTTGDPATPYLDGVALARQLGARLLTFEGNQHTIAWEDNACVNAVVERYLIDAELPEHDIRCVADGE